MKRLVSLILVVALVLTFAGCVNLDTYYAVNIKAPEGKKILISSKDVSNPDRSKKIIYLLTGAIPLADNSTVDLLAEYPDGSEVAISTKFDYVDSFVIPYLHPGFASRTVEVEKK
jgi:hypothetical protein